jgi:hypothetical protein
MVTLIHTLLHFVTLICTILPPTAALAASIRKMGVSKSHLLSVFSTYMRITQSIAAGPIHYTNTVSGIDLVSIHIWGNHSRTMRVLRVMITTRLFFNTVKRSPCVSQSLRIVYTVSIVIVATSLFMAIPAQ